MDTNVIPNPIPFHFHEVAARIGVSVGVGLLVGLEREWAQKEVGVRTFAITALLGTLTALLSGSLMVVAMVAILLLVAFLNIHSLLKDRSLELTTSAALVVVLILGALAGDGHFFTAVTGAILITMLLAWKVELSRFADALQPQEIRGAVLLALLGFVIYPLLPDHFVDRWELINPQQAWVIVLAIAGIGFLNYVLLRLYSTRGLYYAAVLGGLVNSTAAVVELSESFIGREEAQGTAVAVLLLTNVSMFARNIVILALFAPRAAAIAMAPIAAMAVATAGIVLLRRRSDGPSQSLNNSSPVSLPRVIKFALLFVILSIISIIAQRYLGQWGFLGVSLFGGMASSASTTATAAMLSNEHQITAEIAAIATVIASMASALINMPLVYQRTHQRALTSKLAIATGFIFAVGAAVLAVQFWH
jgi:uncharacterized membrane protein (DUF4010 family)